MAIVNGDGDGDYNNDDEPVGRVYCSDIVGANNDCIPMMQRE
jgi:hypothetical protein